MAQYDPQRSRPRRRVSDDAGPAPVDEMLDASPESSRAPAVSPSSRTDPADADDRRDEPSSTAPRVVPSAEVVDLSPVPPSAPAPAPRRARYLLVSVVLALALLGFVLRRIGAARRRRRD